MFRIEASTPADLGEVEAILAAAGLPLDGVPAAFSTGVVARDGDRVVGCAAVEPYPGAVLVRSVAVVPERRGGGIGRALVGAIEDRARADGAGTAYLLTETAAAWFGGLGYEEIDRSEIPASVRTSIEFGRACPDTARAFRRALQVSEASRPRSATG